MTKMAVAAASLVLPDDWLETDEAARYRSFLWDEDPKLPDGGPATAFPFEVPPLLKELIQPPEHLIVFSPGGNHVNVATVLFGSLTAGTVQFTVDGQPPQNAWVCDPHSRTVRESTLPDLITPAAVRRVEEFEAEHASTSDESAS
jgi:hypothetical protein